ncbi:hypothetical protein SAMN04487889_11251, partial [Eubacterium pyruvativorans]
MACPGGDLFWKRSSGRVRKPGVRSTWQQSVVRAGAEAWGAIDL